MALRHVRPNEALARELRDVACDSDSLLAFFRAPNEIIPETFPTAQVVEICQSLSELQEGTAEGCRAPLEYARVRLPAVRREHILGEDQVPALQHEDDAPPLIRGMGLDRLFRDLIASVTTALDEYRLQASEHFDDTVGPELAVDAHDVAGGRAAIEQSLAVEQQLHTAAETIRDITVPESSRADRLRRTVKDAENANRVARAELGMKTVVLRWFRATVDALRDYPTLIRRSADLLELGVDVAEPVWQRWNEFSTDSANFILDQVRKTCETFRGIANKLERRRRGAAEVRNERTLPIEPKMERIEPGVFMMGSEDENNEKPPHQVTVGSWFTIGRYLVTFAEYDAFCEATERQKPDDSGWGRERRPVINVSWQDAKAYVEWLSEAAGKPYRLLSEAEWEYCCRAGTTTKYSCGDEITDKDANFGENVGETTEVGAYPGNPWGLDDMHGNVLEWVEDVWHENYEGAPKDGSAWTEGGDRGRRVLRGGSWINLPWNVRSDYRSWSNPILRSYNLGFRVARTF